MNEIIFLIEEAPEGGYIARALGHSVFTAAESVEALRELKLENERLREEIAGLRGAVNELQEEQLSLRV